MNETTVSPTAVKPCVYVLCFASTPHKHARHHVDIAPSGVADRLTEARTGTENRFLRQVLASGQIGVLADTWDCRTLKEARELLVLLRRQGGGARCCSICHPGNGRGAGRGRNRYGVHPQKKAKV